MCNYQVITTNSYGCIVKCSYCESLHVGFGNVRTAFGRKEFDRFKLQVENLHDKLYAEIVLTGEKIYINTDSEKFAVALSADELNELNTLLAEASVILEVYTILDL